MEESKKKWISASDFYKEKFGKKIYKIAIDAGCTCPTRDGTLGTKGCIFCSASGSGDFVPEKKLSITEQIEKAKLLVAKKINGRRKNSPDESPETSAKESNAYGYIAYFQNFTNTYGNAKELEIKYLEALNAPEIAGISIATRPDCISREILEIIAGIAETHFVSIELGLQTSDNKTAEFIRRGYRTEIYDDAVKRIKKASPEIHIVTQLIFGLPGETEKMMLDSVRHAVNAKTDGIKITCLYVLKGTDLEPLYMEGKIKVLEMDEYFSILLKALALLPEKTTVHRMTGDGPKSLLIAPEWTRNKRLVMNSLSKLLKQ